MKLSDLFGNAIEKIAKKLLKKAIGKEIGKIRKQKKVVTITYHGVKVDIVAVVRKSE